MRCAAQRRREGAAPAGGAGGGGGGDGKGTHLPHSTRCLCPPFPTAQTNADQREAPAARRNHESAYFKRKQYFDGVVSDAKGDPVVIKNAICLHEEDAGMLWKHTDARLGRVEVRRNRRLVVSCVSTFANYEYGMAYHLYLVRGGAWGEGGQWGGGGVQS